MQILPATAVTALVMARALSNGSLTFPLGILAALLTAVAHAVHPWSVFFALLIVFFLGGTAVTRVHHGAKQGLTLSAAGGSHAGSSGGAGATAAAAAAAGGRGAQTSKALASSSGDGDGSEGGRRRGKGRTAKDRPEPRTHVQVLANSLVASVLAVAHWWSLRARAERGEVLPGACFRRGGGAAAVEDLLVVGIVCNYAAVAADTFSSELGILAHSQPRLITSPTLRKVPPGTNGGVTLLGLAAGALGSLTIAVTSALLLPFCPIRPSSTWSTSIILKGDEGWTWQDKAAWVAFITVWGLLGSVLDSVIGGLAQASVIDVRSGKVVENAGGTKRFLVIERPRFCVPSGEYIKLKNLRQVAISAPLSKKNDDPSPSSRKIIAGVDFLDNNAVNFLQALVMSLSGMVVVAWAWDIPLSGLLELSR